jgi:hypothetical protein
MTAPATRQSNKFILVTVSELEALPDPEWLIEGILPRDALGVLYGEPGAGKSFLALDWAAHIADGQRWFDLDVKGGNVIYVCAEGTAGLKLRVRAWRKSHTADLRGLHFLTRAVNMLQENEVAGLMKAIRSTRAEPNLIIIDTLARCFGGGDENGASDMGSFVASTDELRANFPGATVLVVHHTGKDANRRERGHTALRAAADTILRLSKNGSALTLRCDKQKDADPLRDLSIRLRKLRMAGRSSCVIERASREPITSSVATQVPRLSSARKALEALNTFGPTGARFSDWEVASGLPSSTFKDARKRLHDDGFIEKADNGNWCATRRAEAGPTPICPTIAPPL